MIIHNQKPVTARQVAKLVMTSYIDSAFACWEEDRSSAIDDHDALTDKEREEISHHLFRIVLSLRKRLG
jgi:hypothetical protein